MRLFSCLLLLAGLRLSECSAATDPKLLVIRQDLAGFEDKDYASAVERTLREHETRTGQPLAPAQLKKCGLKVSTSSGLGLSTPKPLVRAVCAALLRRGFTPQSLIICDARAESLRQAGFLPTLRSEEQAWPGTSWRPAGPASRRCATATSCCLVRARLPWPGETRA